MAQQSMGEPPNAAAASSSFRLEPDDRGELHQMLDRLAGQHRSKNKRRRAGATHPAIVEASPRPRHRTGRQLRPREPSVSLSGASGAKAAEWNTPTANSNHRPRAGRYPSAINAATAEQKERMT